MAPAEYIERRSLKRMARSNDGYLFGIAIKMVAAVVGSLSSGPLIRFRMISSSVPWLTTLILLGSTCMFGGGFVLLSSVRMELSWNG
jgi:hypothetical protein